MSMVKMTMHQLLALLKRYDDRVDTAINSLNVIAFSESQVSDEDAVKTVSELTSSYDSATHLIDNYYALEAARIKSNAETIVWIGGVKYTVAEAIKRKHLINKEKMLINEMAHSWARAKTAYDRAVEQNNKLADTVYNSTIGQTQNPSSEAIEVAKRAREAFLETHKPTLIDPLDIETKIKDLKKSIEDFETNVDAELSVSNALTTVEVELKD